MKVLVVKLTSMGDAIHVLPALSDLQSQHPDIEVDWMIEESFAEIPSWHSSVSRVVAVATRRWRALNIASLKEFIAFWRELRAVNYDVIIDAQGLMKSAVFSRFAKLATGGRRIGFSGDSIKESPAARLYSERISVASDQHAIKRLRTLFAKGFGYQTEELKLDYQLAGPLSDKEKKVVFLHGTTWASKHIPEHHWLELTSLAVADGYQVLLPWGNEEEKARAARIATVSSDARVLPKSNLSELQGIIRAATAVIAVDTGLGHLAAAIGVPMVSIYGSTNAKLTGAVGHNQIHVQTDFACSPCLLKHCDKLSSPSGVIPCYSKAPPAHVWSLLMQAVN